MTPSLKSRWSRLRDFTRTSSLARSMSAMLILVFGLLILVNATTFVMIQRTASLNQTIEHAQQMRRASRTTLISVMNAETAQRGFLLTGRSDFLQPYRDARAEMEPALAFLDEGAALDPTLKDAIAPIHRLADQKWAEMERTVSLAQQGRIGQSIQAVRSGEGKLYMDELRAAVDAFDALKSKRIVERRLQSERFGVLTVTMNAIAGLLMIVLALLSAWLVRKYVSELQTARETLDAANAGLEDKVRERTGDLMRANEEIQRFAYIVSHDLRAPLVNVMGYTSELEQAGRIVDKAIADAEQTRVVDPEIVTAVREDMPEAIGFIRASTEKMDRLINAILKLSREGRRNLAPETLDMTAMAQNIANSVHHQTEASGARIEVQTLPDIDSDRLSMEQIVGNLIDNAVKYLDVSRPGEIVVSGEDVPGGWVVYRVADNGRGIAPRDHERIFELFRRSGKQDRSGEGLGLAFVRNSVRRIGGTIDVESELGKGSTFLLKFPKRLILAEPGGAL
jgi:signal transduction histidine kinase